MSTQDTSLEITGRTEKHLDLTHRPPLHRQAVTPFLQMQTAASASGFTLQIRSSFRSFDAQLSIWNGKARGTRPVLDEKSQPIDMDKLSNQDKMWAILKWSALPGASRHHWGTDIDVFDAAAVPKNYAVQLIPAEYAGSGVFGPLSQWLDENMAKFGFYRPYHQEKGGVAPERWHLSYFPVADAYLRELTLDVLSATIKQSQMDLKEEVLANLPTLYKRYVINVEEIPA